MRIPPAPGAPLGPPGIHWQYMKDSPTKIQEGAKMSSSFGIAAFRSRTQVLRLEDALRRAGLSAGVISTPRQVAIGCGLSVRFELSEYAQVMAVYRRLSPTALVGFYRVDGFGTRDIRLTPLM